MKYLWFPLVCVIIVGCCGIEPITLKSTFDEKNKTWSNDIIFIDYCDKYEFDTLYYIEDSKRIANNLENSYIKSESETEQKNLRGRISNLEKGIKNFLKHLKEYQVAKNNGNNSQILGNQLILGALRIND